MTDPVTTSADSDQPEVIAGSRWTCRHCGTSNNWFWRTYCWLCDRPRERAQSA